MKQLFLPILILLAVQVIGHAQFTRQDTLRGSITPERAWWEIGYYHLDIEVIPDEKYIRGKNTIRFTILDSIRRMQIDLQPPMRITSIEYGAQPLSFTTEGNAHFITMPEGLTIGQVYDIVIHYEGPPLEANRPPWDAALTWSEDKNGQPFIATTCQGEGASTWWPCKDHPSDEPDSMLISVTVPDPLINVSNGRLMKVDTLDGNRRTFHWYVSNPINHYGVNLNIADYTHFSETYDGLDGQLACNYYVLKYNLDKAKSQFTQAALMLEAFEYWFGPYPFYEDGFKLVEVPYLGMEHQSSVTYGNGYRNGYHGMDLSQSGMGYLFDFIIIHEGGHEWFANNITAADNADMWIHESFTAYSENLYLDYHYGTDTASKYVRGTRSRINNHLPIQGTYGVNQPGSGDMYYKGSNMLHTLRQIIKDDSLWRDILMGLNSHFRHRTITSDQLIRYINDHTKDDIRKFFEQYITDTRIPILEYRIFPGGVQYRWANCIQGFHMPIDIHIDDRKFRIHPRTYWQNLEISSPQQLSVDEDYYVAVMKL